MSGTEGKQNNEMSAKDIEAEEMAQELMNMEMYEVGMGYDQMKELLRFIDDSKNMAGIEPETRSSQESSQYSQEITATDVAGKNNSMQDLISEESSAPKPSFSYRQQSGRASPIISGRKSSREISPVEEMSVTSPDMFENEESKRYNTEGESLFDKLVKENNVADKNETRESRSQTLSKNVWPALSDSSQNSQNSQGGETNVDNAKSRKNQRIERWKLDPTKAVVDDDDVPLRQNARPLMNEKIPYSFCHNRRTFEANVCDKVLAVLTHALEEVADIWRRKHRPDVSEFQWGSPIKVGANNRSLDKKPVIEEADSPPRREILRRNPDSGQRRNMDRNCKRKAIENISGLVDEEVDSDDGDDSIFERVKKPKKTDKLWEPLSRSSVKTAEKSLTRQEKIFSNIQNSNKAEAVPIIGEYDSDDFDNDDLFSLRAKNKKQADTLAGGQSPEVFPRRIVPPNPSKPRSRQRKNGEKNKRKSPVRKNAQAALEKNKNPGASRGRSKNSSGRVTNDPILTMNDEEISSELEKDEPEDNETEIEIKPLLLKGLASKMQHGKSRLLDSKKAEEELERSKLQEQLQKEKEEKMRREEVQIDRYLRGRQEEKEKEAKETEKKAKEEAWKKIEATRDRERRNRQARERKRVAETGQGPLLMDDEDGDAIIETINANQRSMEERVQCPICLLEFSLEEIQGHAADCNQFDNVDNPGTSGSPANNDDVIITNDDTVFDCNICSRYSTTDGIVYEQHVNDCVKRATLSPSSRNKSDSPASITIEVPTSPIRCFLPISKLPDSSIKYAQQFVEEKDKPNKPKPKRRR